MSPLADAVLRSSAVIAAGLLLSVLLRRQSSALRHLVVAISLAVGAGMPVLQWLVPAWTIESSQVLAAVAAPRVEVETVALPDTEATGRHETVAVATGPSLTALLTAIWVAGMLVSAAVVVASLFRLRQLGRRAAPVGTRSWATAAREIADACGIRRPIAVLETEAPGILATWGLWRPRIVLPLHARDWDGGRVRAVLVHEIAHIRRGDWVIQVAAEAVRAVYWFNPLVWLACRELSRHSEGACDAAVLRAGVAPHEYAGHLLEIARSCRAHTFPVAAAVPMARPSTLQSRVAAMLNPRFVRTGLSAPAVALVLVALTAVAVPAAAIRIAQVGPTPLTGVVYDPTGAVLPEVGLTLKDDRQNSWTATSDSAGRFEFAPVQPGRYTLTASLRGFRALEQTLTLSVAADWARAVTLQVGTLTEEVVVRQQRPKVKRTAETGPAPVRVGGNIKPPMKVQHVNPVYPASMQEAGLQGTVPLEALIGRDGSVASVRVVTAQIHPDLAQAAMDAVRQWRFSPTLLNGRAVEVVMNVSIKFELED